jgi:hypothetical protein
MQKEKEESVGDLFLKFLGIVFMLFGSMGTLAFSIVFSESLELTNEEAIIFSSLLVYSGLMFTAAAIIFKR